MLLKKKQQFSPNIIELRFIKTKTEVSIYTIAESELCEQKMIYYRHLISNQNNARLLKKISLHTLYWTDWQIFIKTLVLFCSNEMWAVSLSLHRSGALQPSRLHVVLFFFHSNSVKLKTNKSTSRISNKFQP